MKYNTTQDYMSTCSVLLQEAV